VNDCSSSAQGTPDGTSESFARIAEVKLANVFHGSSWAVRDLQANRNNPEWTEHARKTHTEAAAAMDALIEANFAWSVFGHRPRAMHAAATGKAGRRLPWSRRQESAEITNAVGDVGG
jgi:hypothetical protein